MQDKLATAIEQLNTFSKVPGIASLIEELNKFVNTENPDADRVEELRNPLLTLLNFPFTEQLRSNNMSLADAVYLILLEFAERHPKNIEDPISLEPIADENRVCISTGEVFDLKLLIEFHNQRPPRHTPFCDRETAAFFWDENEESKWLNHPVAGVPFHPKDVEHIRDCCILKDVMILNLRCSHVGVVDRMPKHVRHLAPELASFLRLQDGIHLQPEQGENIKLSFDTFAGFSGFLKKVDDYIKPAQQYMSRYTAMSIALVAINKTGVLPELLLGAADTFITMGMLTASESNSSNNEPRLIQRNAVPNVVLLDEEPEFPMHRRKKVDCCEQMFSRLLSTFSSLFSPILAQPAFEDNENSILLLPPEPEEDNVRYRGFRPHDADE